MPYQSYDETGFDSVNLATGYVVIHIPIISYPQKGTLPPFGFAMAWNQPYWQEVTTRQESCTPTNCVWNDVTNMVFIALNNTGLIITPNIGSAEVLDYSKTTCEGCNQPQTTNYYDEAISDTYGAVHILWPVYYPSASINGQIQIAPDGSGISSSTLGIGDGHGNYQHEPCSQQGLAGCPAQASTYLNDANGNAITLEANAAGFIDSVGRNIPTYPAQVGEQSLYSPNPGCESNNYPSPQGGSAPIQVCWQSIQVSSNLDSYGLSVDDVTEPTSVLSSITLQNGTSWSFTYDSWGAIKTITVPTGAVITYQYYPAIAGGPSPGTFMHQVQSRTITAGVQTATWNYSYSTISETATQTTVTDPLGNSVVHLFNAGCETQTQYFDASAGLLKTASKQCLNWNPSGWTDPRSGLPNVPITESISYANGQMSTICHLYDSVTNPDCSTAYAYDPNGIQFFDPNLQLSSPGSPVTYWSPLVVGDETGTLTYDFGSGSQGQLLRKESKQYLWQENAAYLAKGLMSLVSQDKITDAGGNIVAQINFGYDEANGSPQGAYGNQTSVTRALVPNGPNSKTQTVFNAQGMATATIDSDDNTTTIAYDGTGAYPKTITHPIVSGVAHQEGYQYDLNSGLVSTYTDENGNVTASTYDVVRRPLSVSSPDGGMLTYSYNDNTNTVTSTIAASPDPIRILTSTYDGLGRLIHSVAAVGSNSVHSDTIYDLDGRVYQVSNQYYSVGDPTYGLITYTYDALGRKTLQLQPDNKTTTTTTNGTTTNTYSSAQQWSYSGNVATVIDEKGNQWQRTSDALGRLVGVSEPSGATTSYQYDVLGNLKCVDQWGTGTVGTSCTSSRARSFTYDSLSRLITSANPETGTICYGQWNNSACQNGYDANGNLVAKTDARGVTTSYIYDALNRVIQKKTPIVINSSGGTSGVVSTCYQYDSFSGASSSANLIGHLAAEWTQSGSTCASSYTLSSPPSGTLTATVILSYDSMGRPLTSQQCVKSMCTTQPFTQNQTYDLAGNMTSWQDGRGLMTFSQQFDSAGRPVSLTNSVSGSGLPSVLFSSQGYSPAGALQNWNLGNFLNFNRNYDNRLRVTGETVTH